MKTPKRTLFLFFPILLFYSICSLAPAQSSSLQPDHKLLWKITGNGLEKPSFLYGTMHVQDERVFQFSDSVMLKFQECEVYAMEMTPDSMIRAVMLDMIIPDSSKQANLLDSLTDQERQILTDKLQSTAGVSLDQVNLNNSHSLRYLLGEEVKKGKKKRETFLDAWLYQQARLQGKEVIGLERIDETVERREEEPVTADDLREFLADTLEAERDEAYRSLLDIYVTGNFEEVSEYIDYMLEFRPADLNELYRRNRNMANRAIPIMKDRPCFIAVGFLHLPGKGGLIEMLRNEGYTVEPVPAYFTGLAQKYQPPNRELPWYTHTSGDYYYHVDFPLAPIELAPGGRSGNEYANASRPGYRSGLFRHVIAFALWRAAGRGRDSAGPDDRPVR